MRECIMPAIRGHFHVQNVVLHALNFERMERQGVGNFRSAGKWFLKVCLKPFAGDSHIYSMKRYLGLPLSSRSSVFSARPRVASFSHNCFAGGSIKRLE